MAIETVDTGFYLDLSDRVGPRGSFSPKVARVAVVAPKVVVVAVVVVVVVVVEVVVVEVDDGGRQQQTGVVVDKLIALLPYPTLPSRSLAHSLCCIISNPLGYI